MPLPIAYCPSLGAVRGRRSWRRVYIIYYICIPVHEQHIQVWGDWCEVKN